MAAIELVHDYTVRLDNDEMILVLRSLGGRIKDGEELVRAKELGDRLSVIRAKLVKDRLRQNEVLIQNLRAQGLEVG